MEQHLLQAVLGGQLELSAALAWALGEEGEPPPVQLPEGSPWRSPRGPQLILRPADFRVHVLNTVREQAELVLAAAEQEAGGGGGGSQPPTPQPARIGASVEASGGQLPPAAAQQQQQRQQQQQQQQRAPASDGVASAEQWPALGGARLPPERQRAQRQQDPGRLDDSNFPTLASSAASGGSSSSSGALKGPWRSPAKVLPGQQQRGAQQAQQQAQQQRQGGKRRTIVPAKVSSLEVNPLFQLPQTDLQPQQGAAQQAQQATGSQQAQQAAQQATAVQQAQQQAERAAQARQAQQQAQQAATAAQQPPASPLRQTAAKEQLPATPPPTHQQQQQTPVQQRPAQQAAAMPLHAGQLQAPCASDLALPLSPPPVAIRLPAPGSALAANLLLRGGGGMGGAASPGRGGSGGESSSSTPTRRITPIRMLHPAEVQPTFVTSSSLPATSPRSARRAMLAQPEMQQARSRPGSRLGTPLAGGAAAAAAAFGIETAAANVAASASRLGPGLGSTGSSGGQGSAGNTAATGGSSRSPQLWSASEQSSVVQQLSFDSLLSPTKPAAAGQGAAAAGAASEPAGSENGAWRAAVEAGNGSGSRAAAEVLHHLGPRSTAAPTAVPASKRLQPEPLPTGRQSLQAELNGFGATRSGDGGSVGGSAALGSRQQRVLEAAMRQMAPLGDDATKSSSSGGFDAPRLGSSSGGDGGSGGGSSGFDPPRLPAAATRPIAVASSSSMSSSGSLVAAAAAEVPPLPLQGLAVQPAAAAGVGAGQQAAPEDEPQLCTEARRLAELHAALLRCSSSISLAAELDLLLNLLAVPASVRVDPALTAVTHLWCGTLAQHYACCVLQSAGGLIRGLGPQLLGDLSALPLVRAAFPRLHAAMQQALHLFASMQLHTEKAYRQVRSGSGILSLHGLAAFTSDGRRTRTQEEQRRISNREGCRDEWFNLMKEAAAQTHSFAARQLGRLASGASDRLSESGRTAATNADADEASLLHLMQQSATDLLRRLRPDNFAAFAELFTSAVLQAAATGETLLDEELTSLARKNVGRFHSLNQRMQAQGAAGPSRGGAARLQSNQPVAAPGFTRSNSQQGGRWPGGGTNGGRQQQQQQRGGAGGRGGGGGGGGPAGGFADESVAESLRLVAEFPRPQRLYVLFLEAADSHRLNSHLIRCMTGKLRSLTAGQHGGAGLSERMAAVSILATFLSYLTFTRAGYTGPSGSDAGSAPAAAAYNSSHPVDAAAALEAAMAVPEGGPLAWTLPWVARYLWFLKWDPEAAQAPYFSQLLRRLARLHCAPELQPQAAQFSLAAFCLRSVLDEFSVRLGPDLMPPCPPCGSADMSISSSMNAGSTGISDASGATAGGSSGNAGDGSAGGGNGLPAAPLGAAEAAAATATCPALASLASVGGQLDSRFLHLCCPALEHARQLFASGSSGGSFGGSGQQQQAQHAQQQVRRVKKIRPTAPSGAAAAARAVLDAAPAAAEAGRDLLKLQLQRAFLEQYSTDEHKVKLKDVVDYVSDILAYNCATSAADALLAPAGEAIATALKEAAATVAAASGEEGAAAAGATAPEPPAGAAFPPLGVPPSVRLFLEALAERLIGEHTTDILRRAQAAAESSIQISAVQAMAALTAAERGPAVIGTAAAVAAEVAAAAAEQRLRAHVPSAVRRVATEQLQQVLAAAGKGNGAKGACAGRHLALPATHPGAAAALLPDAPDMAAAPADGG